MRRDERPSGDEPMQGQRIAPVAAAYEDSVLLHAGRYRDILDLLERAPFAWWTYRKWGFAALLAQGKRADALRYAEASRGDTGSEDAAISRACEDVLLQSGMVDEAYRRYGIVAGDYEPTYLARFRALAKRYPSMPAEVLLADLVASTRNGSIALTLRTRLG